MAYTKEQRIINSVTKSTKQQRTEKKSPIATQSLSGDFFLPNHSGIAAHRDFTNYLTENYLAIDGSNANTDINIGSNSLTALQLKAGEMVMTGETLTCTSGDMRITAEGGDINFNDDNLITTGYMSASGGFTTPTASSFTTGQSTVTEDISNNLNLETTGSIILDANNSSQVITIGPTYFETSTGTFNLNDDNLTTTGTGTFGNLNVDTDSSKCYFGESQDAYIEFDGNSLNIVANAVTAADDLTITAGNLALTDAGYLTLGNTTALRAPFSLVSSPVTYVGNIMLKHPTGTGNTAYNYITSWDSTENGSGNTGRLWWFGNGSTSNSHFTINNDIAGANIQLLTNGGYIEVPEDIKLSLDHKRLYFGTSDDASLRFNATDLKIETHTGGDILFNTNCTILADNKKFSIGVTATDFQLYSDGTNACIDFTGDLKVNGTAGWSGTFTNGDGNTVTVADGLITDVS